MTASELLDRLRAHGAVITQPHNLDTIQQALDRGVPPALLARKILLTEWMLTGTATWLEGKRDK